MPVVSNVRDGCMDFTSVTDKWKVEREECGGERCGGERQTDREIDTQRETETERKTERDRDGSGKLWIYRGKKHGNPCIFYFSVEHGRTIGFI